MAFTKAYVEVQIYPFSLSSFQKTAERKKNKPPHLCKKNIKRNDYIKCQIIPPPDFINIFSEWLSRFSECY